MLSIGLTGGIGSGKTQVADLLGELGASIIDTDVIAHQLTAPGGAAIDVIRDVFGAESIDPDGSMDRNWMRQQVFADQDVRLQLQSILHPLISQTALAMAEEADGDYCVFVVPLLIESSHWHKRVNRICVVDCDIETQIGRVERRSGLTRDIIKRIMSTQASRQARLELADDVIVNDGTTTLEDLRAQTIALHEHWCGLINKD